MSALGLWVVGQRSLLLGFGGVRPPPEMLCSVAHSRFPGKVKKLGLDRPRAAGLGLGLGPSLRHASPFWNLSEVTDVERRPGLHVSVPSSRSRAARAEHSFAGAHLGRGGPGRDLAEPRPAPSVLPTQPSAPSGGRAGLGREMSPQGNYRRPSPIKTIHLPPLWPKKCLSAGTPHRVINALRLLQARPA